MSASGRAEEVGVGLMVGAANATAELMQLSQSEPVGSLNDDGVGVGDVDPRLDDGRADQNMVVLVVEIRHDASQ